MMEAFIVFVKVTASFGMNLAVMAWSPFQSFIQTAWPSIVSYGQFVWFNLNLIADKIADLILNQIAV